MRSPARIFLWTRILVKTMPRKFYGLCFNFVETNSYALEIFPNIDIKHLFNFKGCLTMRKIWELSVIKRQRCSQVVAMSWQRHTATLSQRRRPTLAQLSFSTVWDYIEIIKLYSNTFFDKEKNILILNATTEYILSTERFEEHLI